MLNLSDNVEILSLVKGSMPLVKVGWLLLENESGIHGIVQNSVHPEHSWFFFSGTLFATTYLWLHILQHF
jgi:hypothetical protein